MTWRQRMFGGWQSPPLFFRKRPLFVPEPGQKVRLRAGQRRWRGNFRAISYPYTHEGLGVVVRVVEEGGIGRPSERDAARSACPGLPTR
jgi:hypothetical protein